MTNDKENSSNQVNGKAFILSNINCMAEHCNVQSTITHIYGYFRDIENQLQHLDPLQSFSVFPASRSFLLPLILFIYPTFEKCQMDKRV